MGCAANPKGARKMRIELLNFGLKEIDDFVWHPDNSVRPNLIQMLPDGYSHIFWLHSPNLVTEQDMIDAYMETIGNSVYTKEFDNQDKEKLDEGF